MELRDYGMALRRHWRTGVGAAMACLLAAVVGGLATPGTYRATGQVVAASTGEGTSGAQFVSQRVPSCPEVARSRAVLDPVIDELGLDESFADLRARVEASNPLGTSQIDIAVTGRDAAEAARVAGTTPAGVPERGGGSPTPSGPAPTGEATPAPPPARQ